jgi:N-acetyl-anhydromuramyl-L-alanine amidase AmpD
MIADENGAIVIPNTNCFVERNGQTPRWIILHGTAGGSSAQNIATYFQGTSATQNPVSAHYVIGQDGTIVQCNREQDGAWANGYVTSGLWWADLDENPNNLTISIEHVKTTSDNSEPLTRAQQIASFQLIQHICLRHSIPMRQADASGGITGHFSIDPVNRARCPGTFPWGDLWQFLSEQGDNMLTIAQAHQFFQEIEVDHRWRCKLNNIDIAYAILNYYRTCTQVGLNGLSQFGLPLSGEEKVPGLDGVVLQRFERGVICYDPNRANDSVPGLTGPCYPMHIDKGQGQDPRILAALAKKGTK